MRVIGGKLRGKLIHNPTDKTTRPLKDIVRESIFNILEHSKNEKIKFKNDVVYFPALVRLVLSVCLEE